MPGLILFAALVGFPAVEILLLVALAHAFGTAIVLLYLFVSALLGVLLVRLERQLFAGRMLVMLARRDSPLLALALSARYLAAGILLILPGVLTELLALALIVWPRGRQASTVPDGVIEGEFHRTDAPHLQDRARDPRE